MLRTDTNVNIKCFNSAAFNFGCDGAHTLSSRVRKLSSASNSVSIHATSKFYLECNIFQCLLKVF